MSHEPLTSTSGPYLTPRIAQTGDAWASEAAAARRSGKQRISEVATLPASEDVAAALDIEVGTLVVVRRRVVLLDDQPVELADSYYPTAIAAGTALAEDRKIPGGAVTLLADLGYLAHHVAEEVSARRATQTERQALAVDEHAPVIVLTRISFTADSHPFEFAVMVCPADSRTYRYELRVNQDG